MTDKYAVIGNPIAHSKSPQIHRMFAEQFKDKPAGDIDYEKFEAPLGGFAAKVDELIKKGYKGFNVTVPFKQDAYSLARVNRLLSTTARAANTLFFNSLHELEATNTDGIGLVRDIRNNLGFSLDKKRILLMGAGGAARGVLYPLMDQTNYSMSQQSPSIIVVVNRTSSKADQIINDTNEAIQVVHDRDFQLIASRVDSTKPHPTLLQACDYNGLTGQQFDIIINATSSGLTDELPPLPTGIFAPGALAYDMMYGRETPFMKFARMHGAKVADGLGMLVEQAAEAFFIWRGVRPDTAPVIAALREQ